MNVSRRTQLERLRNDLDRFNAASDGPGLAQLTVHYADDTPDSFVVVCPLLSIGSSAFIRIPVAATTYITVDIHELTGRTFTASELHSLAEELFDVARLAEYLARRGHAPTG